MSTEGTKKQVEFRTELFRRVGKHVFLSRDERGRYFLGLKPDVERPIRIGQKKGTPILAEAKGVHLGDGLYVSVTVWQKAGKAARQNSLHTKGQAIETCISLPEERAKIALVSLVDLMRHRIEDPKSIVPSALLIGNNKHGFCDLSEAVDIGKLGEELAAAKLRVAARRIDARLAIVSGCITKTLEDETNHSLIVIVSNRFGNTEARQEYEIDGDNVVYIGEPIIRHIEGHTLIDGLFKKNNNIIA